MRTLIFTISLILLSLNLKAQYYEVDLSEFKLEKPIENVKIEKIIDLRNDQSNIGWVQTGMGNKKIPADFEDTFSATLVTVINNNSMFSEGMVPIIIKVNKFEISERTEVNREYATAEISMEFLARKDSGYIKLGDANSIIQSSSGLDVTDKHPENVEKALSACFAKLASVNVPEKVKTAEVLSPKYLKVNNYYNVSRLDLPILNAPDLKEGVYKSFTEFKSNAPGSSGGHILSVKEALHLTSLGNELDDLWGFSDGKTAYIFQGSSHFPLTRKDNYFTFKAFVPKINTAAILAGAIIAGIPGGLVANAISSDYEEVEFAVSMVSGRIFKSEYYNPQAELSEPAKIIVYRRTRNEVRKKLPLYVNDSLYAEISPYSSSELNFYYPVSEMEFCLKDKVQNCIKIVPVIGETIYLDCSLLKKAGAKPVINTVAPQKAQYFLKLIKDFQKSHTK